MSKGLTSALRLIILRANRNDIFPYHLILQILTLLDITLPIHMLFSFFEEGINSLTEGDHDYDEFTHPLNPPPRSNICK